MDNRVWPKIYGIFIGKFSVNTKNIFAIEVLKIASLVACGQQRVMTLSKNKQIYQAGSMSG
jgi:hypothetical protein